MLKTLSHFFKGKKPQTRGIKSGFDYIKACDEAEFQNTLERIIASCRREMIYCGVITTNDASKQLLDQLEDSTKSRREKIAQITLYMDDEKNVGEKLYRAIGEALFQISSIYRYRKCNAEDFDKIIRDIVATYYRTKLLSTTSASSQCLLDLLRVPEKTQEEKMMEITQYRIDTKNYGKLLYTTIDTVLSRKADLFPSEEEIELKPLSTARP